MQVSDLLVQYQNNLAAGSEVSTGTKGIEQLVDTARQLKVGSIFEGTVNQIKGNQVTLGLSSGQNIMARLDKGIVLEKGQSLFFQVKTNDGVQVQIKPISMNGFSGNPTLMQALDAANLPVSEKSLNMVNAMMKEQMSIDAKSVQDMSRAVLQSGGASASTVVEMTKLNIPLSPSNIQQFENYKEDQGAVLKQMDNLFDEMTSVFEQADLSLEDAVSLQRDLVNFITGNAASESTVVAEGAAENIAGETPGDIPLTAVMDQSETVTQTAGREIISEETIAGTAGEEVTAENTLAQGRASDTELQIISNKAAVFSQTLQPMEEYGENTLGRTLEPEAFQSLQKNLSAFPEFILQNDKYFDGAGQLRPEINAKEFLQELSNYFNQNSSTIDKESFIKLLSDKGYKQLSSNLMAQQWTLQPQELTQEHTVRELYQKMEQQLQQLQEIVDKFPKAGETVSQSLNNLSSNIEFMDQISQMYSYVQIPIRLSGQNVNSELFVYSNKKASSSEDDTLSAFLHFDMEHMGSVDISVKLHHKNVSTNWYLDSEKTLDLIAANIDQLTSRLEEKGYTCDMNFDTSNHKVNFVEDFLKADQKSKAQVHRYSFDVRA